MYVGEAMPFEVAQMAGRKCHCGKPAIAVMTCVHMAPNGGGSTAYLCVGCACIYLERSDRAENRELAQSIRTSTDWVVEAYRAELLESTGHHFSSEHVRDVLENTVAILRTKGEKVCRSNPRLHAHAIAFQEAKRPRHG